MSRPKTYFLKTFGCQMNQADSERIAFVIEKMGYQTTNNISRANLLIINCCSVRQSAMDRVYGLVFNVKQKNPRTKIIITGCVLPLDKKKLAEKTDYILPIQKLKNWGKFLNRHSGVPMERSGVGTIESRGYNTGLPRPPTLRRGARNDNINTGLPSSLSKYSDHLQSCPNCRDRSRPVPTGDESNYLNIAPKRINNFIAQIPISTGCNNFCTYCAVPYVRGTLACRPVNEIIKEAKQAIKNGAKEIWLLGQNVNDYFCKIKTSSFALRASEDKQNSKEINFAQLLKIINDLHGDFWIVFTSPHPKNFSNELIETMAKCKKVVPYLNLPMQSGDDKILKKMNRGYTAQEYLSLIKKIRLAFKKYRPPFASSSAEASVDKKASGGKLNFPPVAISTDVIVGFPNETKKQFNNTKKTFKQLKPVMAYLSQYSPRPGNLAYKLADNVPKAEKKKREQMLNNILKKTALNFNQKFIGKTMQVLISEIGRKGELIGHNRFMRPVFLKGNKNLMGKFVETKITQVNAWGLKGG